MKAGDPVFVSLNEHLAYLVYDTDPSISTVRVHYTGDFAYVEDWNKDHVYRVIWSFAGWVKMQCLADLD
jgi:hypothetical protein